MPPRGSTTSGVKCRSQESHRRSYFSAVPNLDTAVFPWGGVWRESPLRLTAKERILLHLLEYASFSDALDVPPEMTQDGVARAAWIELRHLTQYLRPLLSEGLLQERRAHVKGGRQRRKIYDLTDAGKHAAYRLRERLRSEPVRVEDAAGVRQMALGEAFDRLRGTASLLDLVHRAGKTQALDLDALARPAAPAFVEFLADAPLVRRFVGRAAELDAVTGVEGPRLSVVRGVAGIGKSSFGAKACERLRGTTNLYWHTLRPWDTRQSLLASLGEFLEQLGKPGLTSVLSRGDPGEAMEILRQDLRDARAFLVFDDVHEATPDVLALLRYLKDVLAEAPDMRALVLTRRAAAFYDRRDVAMRGLVREIELGGLSPEDIAAMLSDGGELVPTSLGRRLGGHPLFLELVRSTPHGPVGDQGLRDVRRFIEEEIYGELTETERRTLKMASLFHVATPREALLVDSDIPTDVLLSLANRALLRPVGSDAYAIHETLRDFFASMLTSGERERLGTLASARLRALADAARAAGNPVRAIDYLSNAVRLTVSPSDRAELWEALGDASEKIGDLPAVLTAYKEASKGAADPVRLARLHRKTAEALILRGQRAAAEQELAQGLEALSGTRSAEQGWLDLVACGLAADREDWEDAREMATSALEDFRAHQDALGQGWAHYHLGYQELDSPRGDPREAEHHFDAALEVSRRLGDPEFPVKVHTALAHLYAYRFGDADAFLRHVAAVEASPASAQNLHLQRSLLMLQGWFNLDIRADYPAAERYFREAIDLGKRMHAASVIASAHYALAISAFCQDRTREARDAFEAVASDFLTQGLPAFAVEALWMAAVSALCLGDLAGYHRLIDRIREPLYRDGRAARPVPMKVLEAVDCLMEGRGEACHLAFDEALRLAEEEYASVESSFGYFAHFFYGIALRVEGEETEAVRQIEAAAGFLRRQNFRARLSRLPAAERQLASTFRNVRRTP